VERLHPEGIAASLADVLLVTLSLDLVYVRLAGRDERPLIEVARGRNRPDSADQTALIAQSLTCCLESDPSSPLSIANPLGPGTLRTALIRFGANADGGALIAGSQRPDFPTETERLLLSVGVNQTAIVIERKQLAEEVQQQREWLRVTLASIGDAVITTDTEGKVTFLNTVAQALTGWTQDEAVELPLETVFHIINEQTRVRGKNPAIRALEEGRTVGLANHTILINKDGTERPIDDSAAPIRDEQGHVAGVVLVFRDITERHRAERAMAEENRRKDEFLATLAHELRNPLAPLRNELELMRLSSTGSPAGDQSREMMERQVGQLSRLVDDLLDMSRISQGKIELRKEPVDLAEVTARAIETVGPLIELRRHRFTVDLPPVSVRAVADPARMMQVVANLLTNAAKYTQEGGAIRLQVTQEGDQAVVRVKDSGSASRKRCSKGL